MESVLIHTDNQDTTRTSFPIIRVAGLLNVDEHEYAAYDVNLQKVLKETILPCKTPEEFQLWCDMTGYKVITTGECQQYSFSYMCDNNPDLDYDFLPTRSVDS